MNEFRLDDLDFELPEELIAQRGAERRDASRMLAVDRVSGTFRDRTFTDLPSLLRADDCLVINNTKVFPARLFGLTDTGAKVEIFLVREVSTGVWEALARPARRLRAGKVVVFDERLTAEVIEDPGEGRVLVKFRSEGSLDALLDEIGRTPLPPYIKREAAAVDTDRERYQTVFAKDRGAIAAPTAGLHFTPETLETIVNKGVTVVEITLHVGYGTFEPVRVDDLSEHTVAAERYVISADAARAISSAAAEGRRIVAVGTTTLRALEANVTEFGSVTQGEYLAGLTITPGYEFKIVGSLLTNFHLPRSSLLVLTSVFGGRELIMSAYRHAVAERYRFYSYGDCMFIA